MCVFYRALVCTVYVHLRGEDGQVPVQNNIGQSVDQWLIVDDQEHLDSTETKCMLSMPGARTVGNQTAFTQYGKINCRVYICLKIHLNNAKCFSLPLQPPNK